jgi:type II secretory pathway component PulF
MGQFAYHGRDSEGQQVSGVISAASMVEAGRILGAQSLFVTHLGEARDSGAVRTHAGASGRRASNTQVMWFFSQLSVMVEAGVTLSEALDSLSQSTEHNGFGQIIEDIARRVREGKPLSDTLEQYPRAFSRASIALVRSAEASGTMPTVLAQIAEYLENQTDVVRRVRGALTYPAFMFLAAVSVTVFLLTVILPRFEKIFALRGATLPKPTAMLMALSSSLTDHYLYWLAGIGTAALVITLWYRTAPGRIHRDWLKLNLPVLRGIFHKLYQSRSFRTIGELVNTGVPMVEVLRITRNVADNTYYQRLWDDVCERVKKGERLSQPLTASPLMPDTFVRMVGSGDQSGRLGQVFLHLARFTEKEYDRAIKVATQFIEPLMILVMGSIIGFIAVAVMVPLFTASRVVAG